MVSGFLDGVKDVAKLNDVSAPAAVTDVDAGARDVIDGTMAHGDVLRQFDLHRRRLLLDPAGLMATSD